MNSPKPACIFLLAFNLCFPPILTASEGYIDENGEPVEKPSSKTAHSIENPGANKEMAALHDPILVSRKLVRGLETTRILTITVTHPIPKTRTKTTVFPIEAICLVDKDGLVVGYRSFSMDDHEISFETRLNGVINYLEIYVQCREHGTWLKKVRLT